MSEELPKCPFCGKGAVIEESHSVYDEVFHEGDETCPVNGWHSVHSWQTRASGWVSSDERTPLKFGKEVKQINVLVYMDGEVFETTFHNGHGWCYPYSDVPYPDEFESPTHWMPLPEPPAK